MHCSTYLQKFSKEAPHVFTYIQRIMSLSRTYPNTYIWRLYDERFRRVKQFSRHLPWHLIDQNILQEVRAHLAQVKPGQGQGAARRQPPAAAGAAKNSTDKQPGFCFDFNKVEGCSKPPGSCIFRHQCTKCRKYNHPAFKCTVQVAPKPRQHDSNKQ